MPVWVISLLGAVGFAAFIFAKLGRATGNSSHKQSLIGAGLGGLAVFIFLFTLFKFVFNFK